MPFCAKNTAMNTPHTPATPSDKTAELVAQRRHKYAEYQKRSGVGAYPNGFMPNAHAAALQAGYTAHTQAELIEKPTPEYALAGRIMAVRAFGKLIFAQLQDASGVIQLSIAIDAAGPEVFALFNDCVDLADIVGVVGPLGRTNKGELTVHVHAFTLLTKALQPPPDKWHGLEDIEHRYRQRYIDLMVNPEVRQVFVARSKATAAIRSFLDTDGFMEVETPILQHQAGGASARPFSTHHNALDIGLQLRIAPELFLKRLLVGGFERVYEMSRNFRNEGISTKHNPEFTMLEWYAAYATREDMLALMERLLRHVCMAVLGTPHLTYNGALIDFDQPFTRLTMRDSLLTLGGFTESDLEHIDPLAKAAAAKGVEVPSPLPSYGELFQNCFETLVEPQLIQPTFITDYPIETSPLVRQIPGRPGWTQRSELYIAGREHGELYSELNDPDDQRARFDAQRKKAQQGDGEAMPFDSDFLHALEVGMPPAGGVGLGIDRLVMLLTNQPSIRDVLLFPLLRLKN
jgi:lysyl-tRNA synthetase, class II